MMVMVLIMMMINTSEKSHVNVIQQQQNDPRVRDKRNIFNKRAKKPSVALGLQTGSGD